jgi:hypothetical protein
MVSFTALTKNLMVLIAQTNSIDRYKVEQFLILFVVLTSYVKYTDLHFNINFL